MEQIFLTQTGLKGTFVRCWRLAFALAALAVATGCTINPVTGERELALVTAADEVAIGSAQYLASQQMQGGEYLRDPELSSYVRNIGQRLGAVSERALPYEFVVINSSVPNAWALPGGKIGINRGLLLELDSEAELAAVLGHEIVHAAARHGAQAMQRGMILQGVVAAAAVAADDSDYSGVVVGAAGVGAQLVNMRHGRSAELESDEYGMQYMARAGYDPRAAISLQQTFVRLSESRESGWLAGLFSSHPPSADRVAANIATAARLPATGTTGREEYQRATAQLRRDAAGFEALDAGREALADDNLSLARQHAATAGERLGDSADVAALLGDIEMSADRPAAALPRYNRATQLNNQFFRFHLAKAEAHRALDQYTDAGIAYEASLALLPTADAWYGLGRIAEARGNPTTALEHYVRAAESSGRAGSAAREAAIRIDLPDNPDQYLSLRTGSDADGRLLVEISNPTPHAVDQLVVAISYVSGGQVRQTTRRFDNTIAAGGSARLSTGLGPFTSDAEFEVSLNSARVVNAQ